MHPLRSGYFRWSDPSRSEKKGIKKGENRLGMLMKILLDNKRYADAKRASEDETYREQLYKEFKI